MTLDFIEIHIFIALLQKAMKIYLSVIAIFFALIFGFSQENQSVKGENPIVFIDGIFGFASGSADGLALGYSINYQFKGNLLTFRNSYLASKNKNRNKSVSNSLFFPAYIQGNSFMEYALLYGRRLIFDGSSLSFSAGISTNNAVYRNKLEEERTRFSKNYFAIPYEISFKFFKRDKSRYRVLYGLIPIGQPTSLSRSFGIKLFGSLGKESYLGLGLNFGIGWHKHY